jgi:hypothetical protein
MIVPQGTGILTPSCSEQDERHYLLRRVGVGLRVGGEAALCFACGPQGGVYHPADGYTLADVLAVAERLPQAPGYGLGEEVPITLD